MLWWIILGRVKGTDIKSRLGLLFSALSDTIKVTVYPSSAISPRSYFSGVIRSRKTGCYWQVRAGTDDIYNVMPEREGDVDAPVLRSLGPGDVFIDVGANIGYYTILASRLVGSEGAVIAFEPVPETATALRTNCNLNQSDNITIIEKAAWNEEDILSLSIPHGYYGMAGVKEPGVTSISIDVETATLDSVTGAYSAIKTLKIDVEGAEYRVLCGAGETLRSISH